MLELDVKHLKGFLVLVVFFSSRVILFKVLLDKRVLTLGIKTPNAFSRHGINTLSGQTQDNRDLYMATKPKVYPVVQHPAIKTPHRILQGAIHCLEQLRSGGLIRTNKTYMQLQLLILAVSRVTVFLTADSCISINILCLSNPHDPRKIIYVPRVLLLQVSANLRKPVFS